MKLCAIVLAFHQSPMATTGIVAIVTSAAACTIDNTTNTAPSRLLLVERLLEVSQDAVVRVEVAHPHHAHLDRIRIRRGRRQVGAADATHVLEPAANADTLQLARDG